MTFTFGQEFFLFTEIWALAGAAPSDQTERSRKTTGLSLSPPSSHWFSMWADLNTLGLDIQAPGMYISTSLDVFSKNMFHVSSCHQRHVFLGVVQRSRHDLAQGSFVLMGHIELGSLNLQREIQSSCRLYRHTKSGLKELAYMFLQRWCDALHRHIVRFLSNHVWLFLMMLWRKPACSSSKEMKAQWEDLLLFRLCSYRNKLFNTGGSSVTSCQATKQSRWSHHSLCSTPASISYVLPCR